MKCLVSCVMLCLKEAAQRHNFNTICFELTSLENMSEDSDWERFSQQKTARYRESQMGDT